jgi:peptidyl-prolyl cis-trans isomerase B (cyclophilin B)
VIALLIPYSRSGYTDNNHGACEYRDRAHPQPADSEPALPYLAKKGTSMEEQTNPRVLLSTSHGDITLELDTVKAPITSENFLAYAASGHFDGTIFHRVIPDFMIQGGGFTAGMSQKATNAPIENEADNGLKNDRGTVAMARTSDPHSASSQFFVNLKRNDFLNHTSKTGQGWGWTSWTPSPRWPPGCPDRIATSPRNRLS